MSGAWGKVRGCSPTSVPGCRQPQPAAVYATSWLRRGAATHGHIPGAEAALQGAAPCSRLGEPRWHRTR